MQCFWWQKPAPSSPIVKPNAVYPAVPTLVLAVDIDDQVPAAANEAVADLFPNRTFVLIANSRHGTTGTQCGNDLANRMIETLSPGDTSCASTLQSVIWPAVGRFPLLASNARPATPDASGTNRIGDAERKVVTVAIAAVTDALQRSIIGPGTGVGLRGGTFETPDYLNYTLSNCAFSQDVMVSGTVFWGYDDSVDANLTVGGPGTAGGTLHVTGFWLMPAPVKYFEITGTLGGKHVAVLVPEG